MLESNYIRITKARAVSPRSGFLSTAALKGTPVQSAASGSGATGLHSDLTTWRIANAGVGQLLFLLRDVLTPSPLELTAAQLYEPTSAVTPVMGGTEADGAQPVDAIGAEEIEAEGGGDASGVGQVQIETATAVGTIGSSGAGNAAVVVTGAYLTGSPITLSVAVANNDTATLVAGKIRTALIANAVIGAVATGAYTIGGSGAAITLTDNTIRDDDGTLNVSIDNGTCTGLTAAPTSVDTQAGIQASDAEATYVKTAGTGAITGATAVDTEVTVVAGQWAAVTSRSTQAICGRITTQLTPFTAGNVRVGIEVYAQPYLTA